MWLWFRKQPNSCSDQCTWVNECRADMVTDGSFESPVVTNGTKWDILVMLKCQRMDCSMGWWINHVWWSRSGQRLNDELHGAVLGGCSGSEQYTELDSDWGGPDDNYSESPHRLLSTNLFRQSLANQYKVSWHWYACSTKLYQQWYDGFCGWQ